MGAFTGEVNTMTKKIVLDEVKSARINTESIVTLSLYLDTKNEEKDVTLYIDNVRLTP